MNLNQIQNTANTVVVTTDDEHLIPYEVLKELMIQGVRFSYQSYDHKKAIAELKEIRDTGINPYANVGCLSTLVNDLFKIPESNWIIPEELKRSNMVWRAGRVWEIFFNKERQMYRFKIGNRYAKTFYLKDFGVTVKPMLFKSEDKYNLIADGLAMEERF
jgi:hypothetical protein